MAGNLDLLRGWQSLQVANELSVKQLSDLLQNQILTQKVPMKIKLLGKAIRGKKASDMGL